MEDGVSEDEHLVNSMAISPRKRHKKMEQEGGTYSGHTNMQEVVDEDKVEDEEDGKRGGGFISNLISNLVSPLSPKATGEVDNGKKDEVFNVDMEKGGDIEEGSEVGVFNNLISSMFHYAGEGKGKEIERDASEVGQVFESEKEQDKGSGGGIIDKIVSHLPRPSFPDDAAPPTAEASILIHSIVHD